VTHGYLPHAEAFQHHQRRKKTMHSIEQLEPLQAGSPKHLQWTSCVPDRLSQQPIADVIGHPRKKQPERGVHPPSPVSDQGVESAQRTQHGWDVCGIALQIRVQSDHELSSCRMKPGVERRALARGVFEVNDSQSRIASGQIVEQGGAAVGAGIVHENHFEAPSGLLEDPTELRP
jgi:hypothetical protein